MKPLTPYITVYTHHYWPIVNRQVILLLVFELSTWCCHVPLPLPHAFNFEVFWKILKTFSINISKLPNLNGLRGPGPWKAQEDQAKNPVFSHPTTCHTTPVLPKLTDRFFFFFSLSFFCTVLFVSQENFLQTEKKNIEVFRQREMVSPENTNWLYDFTMIDDMPVHDANFSVSASGFTWPVQPMNGPSNVRYYIYDKNGLMSMIRFFSLMFLRN